MYGTNTKFRILKVIFLINSLKNLRREALWDFLNENVLCFLTSPIQIGEHANTFRDTMYIPVDLGVLLKTWRINRFKSVDNVLYCIVSEKSRV